MAKRSTTMAIGNYKFAFDLDTRELCLSSVDTQMFLDPYETEALGDFLFEVFTGCGRPPRILPLKITNIKVEPNIKEA